MNNMKVYALVGKSGTGKSYQAMQLCERRGIESMIDDGLFIYNNNIMAGSSAKAEPTKVGAIKAALFTKDIRKAEAVRKIREVSPESILILGTSEQMAIRIAARLELPEISEFIHIEDITTPEQIEAAQKQRKVMGKHVVPAPTAQLKRQFSGYFMDPLRLFRSWGPLKDVEDERSVVRPTYSYLGEFYITEKAISDIVTYTAMEIPEIIELKKVVPEKKKDGLTIRILAVMSKNTSAVKTASLLQRKCAKQIDNMTGFNIGRINIEVRELR